MKFGKEFRAQMVPEWQQAYMDYNLLKSILNDIKTTRHKNPTAKANRSLKRKATLHRAFSGLTGTSSPRKIDEEAVLVSTVRQDGSPHELVQTMFMMPSDEGGELELLFFRKLDGEFNKVLAFYRKKVEEVVEEADELTRQMDVLVALRIKVRNNKPLDVSTSKQEGTHMEVIHEVEVTDQTLVGEGEAKGSRANAGHAQSSENHSGAAGLRPASLEILDHVTINVKPETPMSTLKSTLSGSTSKLTFTKEQLKKVEELMKQAFVEFYHKLRLLKSYCFMNQLALSKIMKKYDKITSRNASKPYLDMVDESYLNSCDEVTRLMERVEGAFIKHFSNRNRGKGMNILRPKQRREKHRVTFFLGLFFGFALALVVTLLVLIQLKNIVNDPDRGPYMENVFPLYSLFGFIVLHMVMVSANIYYWGRYKVNYPFIFNLKEGTHLGYRQVFLLSACLSVLSLAAVIANLDMNLDPNTRSFDTVTELVPLILLGVLLLIMICPLNIIYRSTRFFFIASIFRCTLAPLYKVTLIDFYMADQLTSQVQALRSLQFYTCYYIWGNFEQRDSTRCIDSNLYKVIYIVVAIIPYWMRFAQCLRRLIEEKGSMHAWNGLKYFSIIIAVSARTLYEQRHGNTLLIVSAVTSGVATIYASTWDLVVDWGLLQRKSKNRWLRDKLIVPNKAVYFVAIVLNCLLRLAWMQTVMGFREAPFIHRKAMIAIVACLEIIRRGLWNFFRLENEHLNNVGKYRAFKPVPLPFNYEDGEKHS